MQHCVDPLPASRAISVPLTPVNTGQSRPPPARHSRRSTPTRQHVAMLPKLNTRVRFPSSAPRLPARTTVRTVRLAGVSVTGCHNSIQSVTRRPQSIVLGVRIQLHRQACVFVADPRGDHRDRDDLQVHQRGTGMSGGVQLDVPNPCRFHCLPPIPRQHPRRVWLPDSLLTT
jgi:hypothetical protein